MLRGAPFVSMNSRCRSSELNFFPLSSTVDGQIKEKLLIALMDDDAERPRRPTTESDRCANRESDGDVVAASVWLRPRTAATFLFESTLAGLPVARVRRWGRASRDHRTWDAMLRELALGG